MAKVVSLTTPIDVESGKKSINAVVIQAQEDRVDNFPLTFAVDHPHAQQAAAAVAAFEAGELGNDELAEKLLKLHDISSRVEAGLIRVTGALGGRLTISNGAVLVDYDPINATLERHILGLLDGEGKPEDATNWAAFSAFLDNLYANTDTEVRDQLFEWLQAEDALGHGLTFTEDGCFIAYKGCGGTPEAPFSGWSGWAFVDGVKVTGQIPNNPGSTIELPRKSVVKDPARACAFGLHIGTYNYAKGYARAVLLTVKVNPRDVVSVPEHHSGQKVRVCRYEVLEGVTAPLGVRSYSTGTSRVAAPSEDQLAAVADVERLLSGPLASRGVVTFDYVSQAGKTSTRRVRVTELVRGFSGYVTGYDFTAQHYRTFSLASITNLEVESGASAEAKPAPASAPAAEATRAVLEAAVSNGTPVTFTYAGSHPDVTRHLVPHSVTADLVTGVDSDYNYRSFRLSGIRNLAVAAPKPTAPKLALPLDELFTRAQRNNTKVEFTYNGSTRRITVTAVHSDSVDGYDFTAGGPRTFSFGKVSDARYATGK
jgi:predicted DNA-binding transcriptional regulator YafY